MREALVLTILVPLAAVCQLALLPNWLPGALRPDLGLLLALTGVVFLRPEVGLGFLFVLGVQADVLGSGRFGLLTLGYLLAGGAVLSLRTELLRAGIYGVWLAAILGTVVAHGVYAMVAPLCGTGLGFGEAFCGVGYLALSAALSGGIVAGALSRLWAWTGVLSAEAAAARAGTVQQRRWKWPWRRRF